MATVYLTNSADNYTTSALGDTVFGLDGADNIIGDVNSAADNIDGGAGNDTLYGGSQDTISGGDGRDTLRVGGNRATAYGGSGSDRFEVGAVTGESQLYGGTGDDAFVFLASFGDTSTVLVEGNGGTDSFDVRAAEANGYLISIRDFSIPLGEKIDVNNTADWSISAGGIYGIANEYSLRSSTGNLTIDLVVTGSGGNAPALSDILI